MSSDFTGSLGDDSARLGRSSRLSSQRFDSSRFESFLFAESEWMREGNSDEEFPPHGGGYISPPPLTKVISESGDLAGNAPVLATPVDDGFALREWRRKNTIRLEEKERKEKEMLKAIIEEADEYKAEQLKKWKIKCENNRAINREKEKGREKFHLEADQSYWKAIGEIIPKEVPIIEKKGKKDKGGIVVIQGSKPGKPTDLSRMRRILLQLKNAPPPHMTPPPPTPPSKNQGVSTIAN